MTSQKVRKNLLDLQYTTNLQYFNTVVILVFTYFIGLGLAFVSGQIASTSTILSVGGISAAVLSPLVVFAVLFRTRMASILREIRTLKRL